MNERLDATLGASMHARRKDRQDEDPLRIWVEGRCRTEMAGTKARSGTATAALAKRQKAGEDTLGSSVGGGRRTEAAGTEARSGARLLGPLE